MGVSPNISLFLKPSMSIIWLSCDVSHLWWVWYKEACFAITYSVNKLLSCDVLRIYAPLQVSCHLTRSVNIHRTVCHNPFYNKLFHDCAPYATYFVRPTEAYKTTLFIIYLEIFFICCFNDYLNVCTYLTGVDKVLLKLAKEHFLYSFLY